jgi:hypothetical protein
MKQVIKDSVTVNGVVGQTINQYEWVEIDLSFEPSGFYHPIYGYKVVTSWFHPYSGARPTQLI